MGQGKRMDCRTNGEVILEAREPPQPNFCEKAFITISLFPTTMMKGKSLCSMNRPLINSIP